MQLLQFKALADVTRLRLLYILQRYEFSVNELVQIMQMGQSRISRHLKILSEAGLLQFRREGLWIFYTVPHEGKAHDFLSAIVPFWEVTAEMQADSNACEHVLEERNAKSRQFFDTIAEKWDDLNREILGEFDLPAAVAASMPETCRVAADLGCGTGTVLNSICKFCHESIGVDNSQRMLDCCAKRFQKEGLPREHLSLRIGEITHLPLRDHEVQFACINLVLHHVSDPQTALLETRRCLETNGKLFIADFLQHNDEMMRVRYGDLRLGFGREEIKRWLEKAGFLLEKIDEILVRRNLTLLIFVAKAI